MAKVYVVYFDCGYDGYSQPEAVFSEKEKAEAWVADYGKERYIAWGTPEIDELEIDPPLKAGA
jgi:hypothetical protein